MKVDETLLEKMLFAVSGQTIDEFCQEIMEEWESENEKENKKETR